MNIGVFDTEHFETTYTLVKLFDVPENSITLYTNQYCKKHLEQLEGFNHKLYYYELQGQNESNVSFIKRVNSLAKDQQTQLMFYNTISNNHLLHSIFIAANPSIRTILTVHSINDMFNHGFSLNYKRLVKNKGRQMLLNVVKELNVIGETMVPHLKKMSGGKHIIHNIPGSIYDKKPSHTRFTDKLRLVVPGTIDRKRKDYLHAFELLINADAQQLPLEITFLGNANGSYGAGIVDMSKKVSLKHSSFRFFNNDISQKEFDNEISNAHFVFIPVVRSSQEPGRAEEIYGETKMSGAIFDAVRHAKPMIIPTFLQQESNLERCSLRYRDVGNLLQAISELFKKPDNYARWEDNAITAAEHYSLERVRNAHPTIFKAV